MSEIFQDSTEQFLSGGGEMGKLIRSMDWSKTALGPISSWPQSLRTSVSLCLSSTFPILIAWGEETIQIYNDSYRPICGAKHPESMGQNFRVCWETALPVVGDKFTRGQQGEGTYITDQRMFLDRYGYLEETWMTFSFAPIRDESGGVGGIFHPITETTEKMLSGRRTKVLRDLGAGVGKAKNISEIGSISKSLYDTYELDIPFLLFYKKNGEVCELISSAGVEEDSAVAPKIINSDLDIYPLAELSSAHHFIVDSLDEKFGQFNAGPYENSPGSAIMLPIRISGQSGLFGFVVAAVSACRALDDDYLNFYGQLAATFNTAVSNVYAYEQEQKRAEALAEIDRSKTAFFSNVSHEFRTPLTLMLGPLEELLSAENLSGNERGHIEASHRNALRLLKLVNNLLDYSRVEAGRVRAVYRPLDLSELTEDLASSFRSIIEKAGIKLLVDCDRLNGEYFLDQQMWEKIVLNLLSNAFKYTLDGSIKVRLFERGTSVVLQVEDTGVGIPEKELPNMFQRFHRIENTAGRTHEGTGIGLSLVDELVKLHGGTISVESVEGKGSLFAIVIPSGSMHLSSDQVSAAAIDPLPLSLKGAFIKEAASLLEDNFEFSDAAEENGMLESYDRELDHSTRILIVDDNSDMRSYLKRLLEPHFLVSTASNGQEALDQISLDMPALVLSDIMMPVIDGKQMLFKLRSETATQRLPVIFLSARAGEEAKIDGIETGADDYLVKPFSAAELLTKIRAQIHMARTRNHAEQQLRSVLVQAPVAMAIYRGPDHVIELANSRMLDYWGRKELQVLGLKFATALPELEAQGFSEIMDRVYNTGERFVSSESAVELLRFGNLQTIYVNLTIEPLFDESDAINGLVAVAADVTEQVSGRKAVEDLNTRLGLAINASAMGIWQSEISSGKLILSDIAREIHGIPKNVDLSYFDAIDQLIVPQDRERVSNAIDEAIKHKARFDIDCQILPMDGSVPKWINSTGLIELDASGNAVSVIGTILDITEIKKDELRKNDFIGMVSHELKTPLTSLNGFAQLGMRQAERMGEKNISMLFQKALAQVGKMSRMINGFLNVSQLESGKIVLSRSRFDLGGLILEVVEDVKLASPGEVFEVACQEVKVDADRDKVGTVLANLLSNAVKYGKTNTIITVNCETFNNRVRVSVHDQGMGIKPLDLEKLFDRFYRVENAQTQHIAGFGIGLYLSAEIIERHGGRIWAESEFGNGATFYFELPLEF